VSVSNACASTPQGLQVFYRDESQGILLGAVKTSNGWVYEIVDGDKTSEGRTTGDVAFHLSATSDKNTVYLIYDSVLTINSNRDATSGEVRLAIRKTVFPEDWRYQTLDGPDNGNPVAGYATAIFNNQGSVAAAWLVSHGNSLSDSKDIRYLEVNDSRMPTNISTSNYGSASLPLSLDSQSILFGCEFRLCQFSQTTKTLKLVDGVISFQSVGVLMRKDKGRFIVTARKGVLSLLKLKN
jgi:hypothetical protein